VLKQPSRKRQAIRDSGPDQGACAHYRPEAQGISWGGDAEGLPMASGSLSGVPQAAPDQLELLIRALGVRWRTGRGGGTNIVMPLHGGAASLLGRGANRRLVTIVDESDVGEPAAGIRGWLEKRQARRSALLVVPDRAAGVAMALRWGISPERFRIASSFDPKATNLSAARSRRPWHSRR
jgi:hypothetical protein